MEKILQSIQQCFVLSILKFNSFSAYISQETSVNSDVNKQKWHEKKRYCIVILDNAMNRMIKLEIHEN